MKVSFLSYAFAGRLIGALLVVAAVGQSPPAQSLARSAPQETAGNAANATPASRLGRSGLPLPRFVSLRAHEVNMRTGPGIRYPIEWVYRRAGLPVVVIDEFENWRRVRDWEGSVGWVHQSMLSSSRSVIVVGKGVTMRRDSRTDAPAVARLATGVIGTLDGCGKAWCQVRVKGFDGWLPRTAVFGAPP